MESIRLATPEEIAQIESCSDITSASSVMTFGGKDFVVIRNCFEADPFIFHPDSSTKRRMLFAMNVETALRFQGVREIYFNAHASDEEFLGVLKTWGANPTSTEPEIRFKKVL